MPAAFRENTENPLRELRDSRPPSSRAAFVSATEEPRASYSWLRLKISRIPDTGAC